MIEVGKVLQNRYRIEKQIGQGGMGKVYVASDERFNSTVAIKETIFEDTNLRRAFEREAKLLNSLKHLALPRVSDHFNEDDGQFLVMEYIAGEDLAEMMERNGKAFPLETVLNWANQLCDALEYLHTQDIIHRDIKPQNLKLTPSGQIVLLDFGLAKGNPTDSNNQTAAKSIFGYSRSYASLEQIQGTGTEPRSDLYSLAATLYHLLTGIPPADALTRAMNVLNKQPDPLIPANIINNNVPAGVANVLQSSMALNASERPASAKDLRQMLDESDKYVNLNADNLSVFPTSTANLLTQETKIKPLASDVSNQSRVETQIIPGSISDAKSYQTTVENNDSIVTTVRSEKSPNRAKKVVAATVGGLILAGSVFSAVYLYNSDSPENTNVENVAAPQQNNLVLDNSANTKTQNINTTISNKTTETGQSTANQRVKNNTSEPTTSAGAGKPRQTQIDDTKNQPAKANKDFEKTPVIINGDKVETDEMIIDENGIKMKNPNRRNSRIPRAPTTPNTPYQGLSPEQIEKLKNLENMKKRYIIVKPPTPRPTPQNPDNR